MSFKLLQEWCQVTVHHGIRDLYDARSYVIKAMWSVIVVTGFFFAVTQSIELILHFMLDNKWSTRVSMLPPPGGLLEWPNVTVCFSGRLYTSQVALHNLTDPREIAYLASPGDGGLNFYDTFFKADGTASPNSTFDRVSDSEKEALLDSMAVSCEDTILSCGLNHGFRFSISCNCSKISLPRIPGRPRCFRIDSGRVFRHGNLKGLGYENGARLLINPRTNKIQEPLFYDETGYGGIELHVHFGEDSSDGLSSPIFVASGTSVAVAMKVEKHRTTIRKRRTLNFYEPEAPCASVFNYKWLNTSTCSRSYCQWDCYGSFLMEFCGCVFRLIDRVWGPNVPTCSADQDEQCWETMKEADWKSMVLPTGFNYSRCISACKDPCEFDVITTRTSTREFPAPGRAKSLARFLNQVSPGHNFSEEDVKQLITVHLFFVANEYKLFETVNTGSLDELISSIGGTLGVWTGLSLIGIFQAFVYLFYCVEAAARRAFDRLSKRTMISKQSETGI